MIKYFVFHIWFLYFIIPLSFWHLLDDCFFHEIPMIGRFGKQILIIFALLRHKTPTSFRASTINRNVKQNSKKLGIMSN
jgi:hypothetical protein